MQVLVDLAVQFERRVAFVGRSMVRTPRSPSGSAFCAFPPGADPRRGRAELCLSGRALHHDRLAGRAAGGASRIAIDDHRFVQLGPRTRRVFSARPIPGNEKAIARTMSHIARGVPTWSPTIKHVHVSGHGSAEELKLMLSLVRPRYFVPIHGEYRSSRSTHGWRSGSWRAPTASCRSCWPRMAT